MSTAPEHIAYEAWIDQHPLGYPGIEYDAFVAGYRAALQLQHNEEAKNLRHALWVANGAIGILQKKLDALQSQDRSDAERYRTLVASGKFVPATLSPSCLWGLRTSGTKATKEELDAAIDHARRVEGEGE